MDKKEIPIYKKMNLTIEQAASYSGIGESTLREYIKRNPNAPFLMYVGTKALIKRKEFEEWNSKIYLVK